MSRFLRSGRAFGSSPPVDAAHQGYCPPFSQTSHPSFGQYPPPGSHDQQLPPQSIPPSQVTESVNSRAEATAATLDSMKNMLDTATPTSEFEKLVVNYLGLLTAQMREIKIDVSVLNDRLSKSVEHTNSRFNSAQKEFMEIEDMVIKTEQYSRRDAITVSGLSKPNETETSIDLGNRIANTLSKSGIRVKPEDLSAFHRNSKENKIIKLRDGRTKEIPPSVTARFRSTNMKDEVMRNYKNFDSVANKPNDIRIYHSLTPHYSMLRRSIEQFFKDGDVPDNELNPHKVQPHGKQLKWCKYQSHTSGIVLKLKSDEYIKGVHSWYDFCDKYYKLVELGATYLTRS